MEKNKLYLECYSGISGDMTVAALLDVGADKEKLNKAISSLNLDGYKINISKVIKNGISACDFDVILDKNNHDHDMNYLHGDKHEHLEHHHDHKEEHHHEHRGLKEIMEIINKASISENAKEIALKIFDIIADAEAIAHNIAKDEVHFHEVGAMDSIIDIVSAAVCLDDLNVNEVIVSDLYEGRGFIRCAHGNLPVPVPAVANIVKKYNLSLHITDKDGEFVTPTGASIIAAIKTSDSLPEKFTIEKIGYGAGKRNYDTPSLLRAMIIK